MISLHMTGSVGQACRNVQEICRSDYRTSQYKHGATTKACKLTSIALLLVSGSACAQALVPLQKGQQQPLQVLRGRIGSSTVTYSRYNTEDEPCITLSLSAPGVTRQLCQFTYELGNVTDVRTGVAAVDYLGPKFRADSLEVTLDLISYYLDCTIPLTESSIGDPVCTLRDMDY